MEPSSASAAGLSSQQQPSGVSKQALRPVTIRQVMRAKIEENRLSSIDGVEFDLVTLVASVVSAENKSGMRSYSIEDGTGRIRARQWLPVDKDKDYIYDKPEDLHALTSTYIRVYGKPSTYKGYISLEIQHARQITDPHEIYFHIMESIVATLQYTRGPPPGIYESSSAQGQVQDLSASFRSPTRRSTPPSSSSPASAPASSSSSSSSSSASRSVNPLFIDDDSDRSPQRTPDESPSDNSLEYVSTSDHSDSDDEDNSSDSDDSAKDNDLELAALRNELEAPSTPPPHRHHALCRCLDRPMSIGTPLSPASSSTSVTPTRHLRPDPYSRWSSLERNIILHIHTNQGESGDAGVSIYSIGAASKLSNPSEANSSSVK